MKNKNKFRLNSNKKVLDYNINLIKPQQEHEDYNITSFSMTKETRNKLENLRAKYKVSRSALMRILLDSVE